MSKNKRSKNKSIKFLIGIAISIFLIVWLLGSLNLKEVFLALIKLNYQYLFLSLPIIFLHFLIRSYRWKYLIKNNNTYNYTLGFDSIQLGNFVNYILPFRAGEIARPLLLSKKSKIPFTVGMASVVVERFFDLFTVLCLFALLVFRVPNLPDWSKDGAYLLGLLAIFLFLGILSASFCPKLLKKTSFFFLNYFPEKLKKGLIKLITMLIEGASVLNNFKSLIMIIFYSILIWGSNLFLFYIWSLMLPDPVASFDLALALSVLVALAVAAPSAPGFIGVFQAGCVGAFVLFGISKEYAMAYAIITHVFQYIIYILYGIYLIFKYGLNVRDYSV